MLAYKYHNPIANANSPAKASHQIKLTDISGPSDNEEFADASEPMDNANLDIETGKSTVLVNAAACKAQLPPFHIRHVLSNPKRKPSLKVETNVHNVVYHMSSNCRNPSESLVDRGTNSCIAGSNTRLIAKMD